METKTINMYNIYNNMYIKDKYMYNNCYFSSASASFHLLLSLLLSICISVRVNRNVILLGWKLSHVVFRVILYIIMI